MIDPTWSPGPNRDDPVEPGDEVVYVREGSRPMSHCIVDALERNTDVDLPADPPIGYVVDLEAIDMLYSNYDAQTRGKPPVLKFCYQEYKITIEDHRTIRISPEQPSDFENQKSS